EQPASALSSESYERSALGWWNSARVNGAAGLTPGLRVVREIKHPFCRPMTRHAYPRRLTLFAAHPQPLGERSRAGREQAIESRICAKRIAWGILKKLIPPAARRISEQELLI